MRPTQFLTAAPRAVSFKLKYAIPLIVAFAALLATPPTFADDLTSQSRGALRQLVAKNPAAARVSSQALAVLVFPNVVKAGFIVGAQGGDGVLFVHGRRVGRYRTVAGSYGLQAGVQKFGYALFLMNQRAVDWVNKAHGWSLGSAPSLVVVDKGMAKTVSTETLHSGIYAFTFSQKGLMGGLGIQGAKIERLD
jgi:lipid-binding SYLF domain-containing protein